MQLLIQRVGQRHYGGLEQIVKDFAPGEIALIGNTGQQQEGDQRTPEGRYTLDYKKSNSGFYKAIHINYPNLDDIKRANELGVRPGGMIMIHGQLNRMGDRRVQPSNWTNGCIAVLNHEMDEIWNAIEPGTPIVIEP